MSLVAKTYWGGVPFRFRRVPEGASVEAPVLRTDDLRDINALYWTKAGEPRPRVAVVCMHPRVDFTRHYAFPRLVAAGVGCLGALSRSPNDDTDTEHEALLLDVAACVRWLRERRGVDKVLLLGNSGGGSLSAYYQAEARAAPAERVATSPGGTPTRLGSTDMPKADGLILVAAHRGQGKVLGACIDPAVVDERDPSLSDPSLDLYSPDHGFREPPAWSELDEAFVERYRRAQRERVARLDALARAALAGRDAAAEAEASAGFASLPAAERRRLQAQRAFEPVMVIYRTMANPAYVDRRIEPSGREYGSLLSDRPDLMNYARLGFARTVTPRAWLSTWSALSSRADLVANAARVAEPVLLVAAGRDREVYPQSDVAAVFEALASADKTRVTIEGARHYFEPDDPFAREAPDVERLMDVVVPWIRERFA